jgi:hypothetical protein
LLDRSRANRIVDGFGSSLEFRKSAGDGHVRAPIDRQSQGPGMIVLNQQNHGLGKERIPGIPVRDQNLTDGQILNPRRLSGKSRAGTQNRNRHDERFGASQRHAPFSPE